ncbi:hypothetical protein BDD14_2597 [Edaphobacter modestus]|uniref:Uncharacterized protein n=1 Tax=Edaphobacter modestus TaxID=388466 RepID=A0A4Q7YVD7_9BACT|nr:hypothetical protein BDD14_2597 [Edaphobacter modestus]
MKLIWPGTCSLNTCWAIPLVLMKYTQIHGIVEKMEALIA